MKNWIQSLLVATMLLPASLWAATISGYVRAGNDGNYTYIANALVVLRQNSPTGTFVDSVRTAANGTFTFTFTASGGDYNVSVTATGYQGENQDEDQISANESQTSNFTLDPVTFGTILGTVRSTSSTGQLIDGALIYLRRGSATGAILDSAITTSNGAYVLNNVAGGQPNYWITASAAGYTSVTNTNVSIPTSGVRNSNFILIPGSTGGSTILIGTVTNAAGGAAIAGATVALSGVAATTTTNAAGVYTFIGVSIGAKTVTASAAGFTTNTGTANITATNTTTTVNIALTAISTTGASISGTVTNAAGGAPIAGALVILTGTSTATTTTSATGSYSFPNLTVGSKTITVTATGFNSSTATVNIPSLSTTSIVNIALSAVGVPPSDREITGRVTDLDGETLVGAVVTMSGSTATAVSDESGAYILSPVTTGTKTLTATLAGFTTTTVIATVAAGSTTTVVDIQMPIAVNIQQIISNSKELRFSNMGHEIVVDLGFSVTARTVLVYSPNGTLRNQTFVPAGASRVLLPAAFSPANGFLFQVK